MVSGASAAAVASIRPAFSNMPVLMAATGRSLSTASIWAARASGGRASTRLTPQVFWAVTQVIAEQPCTCKALNVLRSA